MTEAIDIEDYELFSKFLKETCGIVLGENKHYLVSSRLKKLLEENKMSSVGILMDVLRENQDQALKERIIDAMTTNETYWFRDSHPFKALETEILPEIAKKGRKRIRIWSAACSTGQEPYSISMVCERFLRSSWPKLEIEIVATDISPSVLKFAREGIYDEMSLSRGLPEGYRELFFEKIGGFWRVKDRVRKRVSFIELNLMKSFATLGKFDVVFCRNVLIYFSRDLKEDILRRIAKTMTDDSHLLLGGSESMSNYANFYETERSGKTLFYKLKAPVPSF